MPFHLAHVQRTAAIGCRISSSRPERHLEKLHMGGGFVHLGQCGVRRARDVIGELSQSSMTMQASNLWQIVFLAFVDRFLIAVLRDRLLPGEKGRSSLGRRQPASAAYLPVAGTSCRPWRNMLLTFEVRSQPPTIGRSRDLCYRELRLEAGPTNGNWVLPYLWLSSVGRNVGLWASPRTRIAFRPRR